MVRLVFALLVVHVLLAQPARIKVILDTDIGTDIDDAWAVAFTALHPQMETLAITITDADTTARAKVACKLLARAGRTDIPVAAGRKTATPDQRVDHQFSWAEDFTGYEPVSKSAADLIVETVKRYPGEVILVAVGPLQNIADALRIEPNLGKYVKRVVLMSGNVYGRAGNQPVIPEWNVVVATQDSQRVYGAGLPLTIVPLDATTMVTLKDEERDRVRNTITPVTVALEALYRLWLDNRSSRMTLHDQLAVAESVLPGTFFGKQESLPLVVDDAGFTRIDKNKGRPVTVCLQPKRDEFMRYYIGTITKSPR